MNLPTVSPQLATAKSTPPTGKDYCHEIKYDGFRMMAYLYEGRVKILTRNGNNWTYKFSNIVSELKKLKIRNAILDGELVVFNSKDLPDFHLLQKQIHTGNDLNIFYYIFDVLYLNNIDLKEYSLQKRKKYLNQIFKSNTSEKLIECEYIIGNGPKLYQKVYELGLEGIISKKLSAPYVSGRNTNWFKCKCYRQEKFILIGFKFSKDRVASFLLAQKLNRKLLYRGRVTADFMNIDPAELVNVLSNLIISNPYSSDFPYLERVTWLQPTIELTIRYIEKTENGYLRQATFLGIDKINL